MIDPITQIAAMNGWMREQREKQPPRPGPTRDNAFIPVIDPIPGHEGGAKEAIRRAINTVMEFTPIGDIQSAVRVADDVRGKHMTPSTMVDAMSIIPGIGAYADYIRATKNNMQAAGDVIGPAAETIWETIDRKLRENPYTRKLYGEDSGAFEESDRLQEHLAQGMRGDPVFAQDLLAVLKPSPRPSGRRVPLNKEARYAMRRGISPLGGGASDADTAAEYGVGHRGHQ